MHEPVEFGAVQPGQRDELEQLQRTSCVGLNITTEGNTSAARVAGCDRRRYPVPRRPDCLDILCCAPVDANSSISAKVSRSTYAAPARVRVTVKSFEVSRLCSG